MSLGEALHVPILWWTAEKAAEDLIVSSEGGVSPATFEFRATRDVLAITFLLADVVRTPTARPGARADALRAGWAAAPEDYPAIARSWLAWSQSRLDDAHIAIGAADRLLAHAAWRWLRRGRLLTGPSFAGPSFAGPMCEYDTGSLAGAACCVGLRRARRIIDMSTEI